MEAADLKTLAARFCRDKANAYAAMWGVGQLSFHHGNRLRTALQIHLVLNGFQSRPALRPCKCHQVDQLVKQHNMDVNQQMAPLGRTALHAAAEAGHVGCCQLLLEQRGADAYVYDNTGVSAMMLAACHGHHAVIKVLLDAGADPFAVDHSGTNALLLAASCSSSPSVKLLLQEGCVDADYHNSDLGSGEHASLLAAERGSVECVGLLLASGARVNRTDKDGSTALWDASRMGHLDVVRVLLGQPHTKHIRHFLTGTTPLMEAQAGGHNTVAAMLTAHAAQQQTHCSAAAVCDQQQQHSEKVWQIQQQQQRQEQQGRQWHQHAKQQQQLRAGAQRLPQLVDCPAADDQVAVELSDATELVNRLLKSLAHEESLDAFADDGVVGLSPPPLAMVC